MTSCSCSANCATCARSCSFAGVTCKASKWPKVSTPICPLLPRWRLAPSEPARGPLSGLDCRVRLSRMTAEGCTPLPSATASANHRRWPRALQHSASVGPVGTRLPTVAGRSASSATGPRPHEPAQPIEDFTQTMRPLGRVCGHEREIGGHKGPFVITGVAGVGIAFHTSSLASSTQSA